MIKIVDYKNKQTNIKHERRCWNKIQQKAKINTKKAEYKKLQIEKETVPHK